MNKASGTSLLEQALLGASVVQLAIGLEICTVEPYFRLRF